MLALDRSRPPPPLGGGTPSAASLLSCRALTPWRRGAVVPQNSTGSGEFDAGMANLKSGDDYVFYNWYSGERPVSAPPPHTLETGTAVRDPSPPPPTPHACYEGRGTRFNAPCPSAKAEALTSVRLKAVRTESPFPHDPLKTECTEYDCSGVVDPRTPLESGVWLSGSRAHQALFCPVLVCTVLFWSGLP